MGRLARGVRGIRLGEDDEVVGLALVEDGRSLLTMTENGFGKRTDFEDFRSMKNRGGHGVACHKISDKTGALAALASVSEDDDVMIITDDGTIIRTPVSGIPTYSRTAGGVIVMRLSDGAKVMTFSRAEKEEEIEKLALEAENAVIEETGDEDDSSEDTEKAEISDDDSFDETAEEDSEDEI
jgi:DNA gyrase subunit A